MGTGIGEMAAAEAAKGVAEAGGMALEGAGAMGTTAEMAGTLGALEGGGALGAVEGAGGLAAEGGGALAEGGTALAEGGGAMGAEAAGGGLASAAEGAAPSALESFGATVAKQIGSGIVSQVATSLLQPRPTMPTRTTAGVPVASAKKTVMPTADDAAIQAARRRSLVEQYSRRGRASTILTGGSDKVGG